MRQSKRPYQTSKVQNKSKSPTSMWGFNMLYFLRPNFLTVFLYSSKSVSSRYRNNLLRLPTICIKPLLAIKSCQDRNLNFRRTNVSLISGNLGNSLVFILFCYHAPHYTTKSLICEPLVQHKIFQSTCFVYTILTNLCTSKRCQISTNSEF